MKKSTHNQYEAPEKQHYKKKYLERLVEDEEAEQEMKNYLYEQTKSDIGGPTEVSQTPSVD